MCKPGYVAHAWDVTKCVISPVDCKYTVNTCSCSPGCDVTVPTCTCDNTYTVTVAAVGTGSCSPNVGQSTYSGSVCPLYCSGAWHTYASAVGGCGGGWSEDYQIYKRTANGNAEGDDSCPGHNTYRTANRVKNNNGCPVDCAGSWAYSSTTCPPACGGGSCAQTQIYTRTTQNAHGGDNSCPQTNAAREVNPETHGNTCAVNCAGSWAETSNSYPGNCGGGWQGMWFKINTYTRTSDAANGGDDTCPATGDISVGDSGTNNNACPTPAPPPPTPPPPTPPPPTPGIIQKIIAKNHGNIRNIRSRGRGRGGRGRNLN